MLIEGHSRYLVRAASKNCDCSWNGRLGTVVSRIQTANAIINSQGIQIVVEAPVYLVNNILK